MHVETREVAGFRFLPAETCSIAPLDYRTRPRVSLGFAGLDLGSLEVGGKLAQFPGGPLPNQNLVKIG